MGLVQDSFVCQVQKSYVTHMEVDGHDGQAAAITNWKRQSLFMAKRKLGMLSKGDKEQPKRKRRRTKAFQTMMSLSNMLEQVALCGLDRFAVRAKPGGALPNPFSWPHLNLAADQGADNVAMDHFLAYEAKVNIHTDWDLSHGAHNDAVKCALKDSGLWRHILTMCSAQNCAYGSTLSPPTLAASSGECPRIHEDGRSGERPVVLLPSQIPSECRFEFD